MSNSAEQPKPRRRWMWIVGAVVALAVGVSLGFRSADDAGQVRPGGGATGYRIEDGTVAWRPMSGADQFVVGILTLGQGSNSPSVRGRTMPLADASSFRTLSGGYGVDNSRVWFEGDVIDGADPRGFAVLGHGFSHDDARIWQGVDPVLTLEPGQSEQIEAFSRRIVAVGPQVWLTGTPPIVLPEVPQSAPEHFCRDWFVMNDALWLGAQRLLPLDGPLEVLDCDGSVRTQYTDRIPREDIDHNDGILVLADDSILRLGLNAEQKLLASLPEPVAETLLIDNIADDRQILLTRTNSGMVRAHALNGPPRAQPLGQFDSLPQDGDVFFDRAFLLGGRYFTMPPETEPGEVIVVDRGPARRIADLVLAGDALFKADRVVARPGDMPLREIDGATVLVGTACLNFGVFVTDVADPAGDPAQIKEICQTMWRPSEILYQGLRIGFSPLIVELGPNEENPQISELQVGRISIRNVTGADRVVTADVLQSFDLKIMGTSITPPEDAWPAEGLSLAANETHGWTLQVQTDDDPTYWGWTLSMRHDAERAEVFGDEQFYILQGQFLD